MSSLVHSTETQTKEDDRDEQSEFLHTLLDDEIWRNDGSSGEIFACKGRTFTVHELHFHTSTTSVFTLLFRVNVHSSHPSIRICRRTGSQMSFEEQIGHETLMTRLETEKGQEEY